MIFDLIEKHRIAFVAVMSIAMFGIYLGLSSCIAGGAHEEAAGNAGEETESDTGDPDSPARSREQAEYMSGYTAEEESIIKQLAAASWRGGDGTASIDFESDGSFTETVPSEKGAEVRNGRIAIAAVDTMVPELSQDGSITLKQFICLLDTGEYAIFHLTRSQNPQADSRNPVLYLSSPALEYGGEYTTEHACEGLKVEGVGKEISTAVSGDTAGLKKAVADYVRANHSSCHTASWDKTISTNYETGAVVIGFALTSALTDADGAPETEYIQITYHMDTDSFEGGEA